MRDWTYDALYTLLTHEAKERFGLIKGYRLILKIEGCSDLAGIQAVALDFVEQHPQGARRGVRGALPQAAWRHRMMSPSARCDHAPQA